MDIKFISRSLVLNWLVLSSCITRNSERHRSDRYRHLLWIGSDLRSYLESMLLILTGFWKIAMIYPIISVIHLFRTSEEYDMISNIKWSVFSMNMNPYHENMTKKQEIIEISIAKLVSLQFTLAVISDTFTSLNISWCQINRLALISVTFKRCSSFFDESEDDFSAPFFFPVQLLIHRDLLSHILRNGKSDEVVHENPRTVIVCPSVLTYWIPTSTSSCFYDILRNSFYRIFFVRIRDQIQYARYVFVLFYDKLCILIELSDSHQLTSLARSLMICSFTLWIFFFVVHRKSWQNLFLTEKNF